MIQKEQSETIVLAEALTQLERWGFHNVATEIGSILFPGAGILTGLVLFCFNPVWWIIGPVFAAVGLHRLEKGDFTGARKALWWGRGVNWAIVFAVVFWGFLAIRSKAGP